MARNPGGVVPVLAGLLLTLILATPARALEQIVDFEGLADGLVIDEIVLDQGTTDELTVSIGVTNLGGGPDLAVIFDSSAMGTADPDLEFPDQGNILIIQENTDGCSDVGDVCNVPDDEGDRPAGTFRFDFSLPLLSLGLDVLDIDDARKEREGSLVFEFLDGDSTEMVFEDIAGFSFGDNSQNVLSPQTLADLGSDSPITALVVNAGGSIALDTLRLEVVPEPTSMALVALGLLALAGRRRTR